MNFIYQIVIEIPGKGDLKKVVKLLANIAKSCKSEILGPISLPIKISKFAVLKSPHVFKKSREHFEKIQSKIVCYINVNKEQNLYFNRFFAMFAWSYLGIGIKKTCFQKKHFYI